MGNWTLVELALHGGVLHARHEPPTRTDGWVGQSIRSDGAVDGTRVRGPRLTILLVGGSVPNSYGRWPPSASAPAGMCLLPPPYDRGSD